MGTIAIKRITTGDNVDLAFCDASYEKKEIVAMGLSSTLFLLGAAIRLCILKDYGKANTTMDFIIKSKMGIMTSLLVIHCFCINQKGNTLVRC